MMEKCRVARFVERPKTQQGKDYTGGKASSTYQRRVP
jgi:hypothetical protein